MTRRITAAMLAALAVIALTTPVQSQALDDHLKIFAPLIGPSWEGHFEDTSESRPTIMMSLESALEGKVVRLLSGGGGMTRENLYYWDPEKKQICYVALTSNGWVSTGTAYGDGALIVTVGRQIGPDGTPRETKNTWEVTTDGKAIARGYRMENGEWKTGHVIIYTTKPKEPLDNK
jgi:hypothetical protein